MKNENKNYHNVATVPQSDIKIVERDKIDTLYTNIHDRSLSWHGTLNTHIHDRSLSSHGTLNTHIHDR